jgi:mannose-1-phosphate guanylyltransferase
MMAMVLAAGLGVRMRPLTERLAKPALPVLNCPLVHWTLKLLADHGVTDVVVNVHHLPETVRQAVGDGKAFGLRVHWSREPRLLGTGGALRHARRLLRGDDVLVLNGDYALDLDLRDLVDRHQQSGAAATLALRPNPDVSVYGPVRTTSEGWIRSILGRPAPSGGRLSMFAGVHVIRRELLERLPSGVSDSIRDLYIPLLASGERLLGVEGPRTWFDFGTPAMYRESQIALVRRRFRGSTWRSVSHPDAEVSQDARVVRSVVGPGARVGAGSLVAESVLWAGVEVGANARVVESVLAEGAVVRDGASVVGRLVYSWPKASRGTKIGKRGGRQRDLPLRT